MKTPRRFASLLTPLLRLVPGLGLIASLSAATMTVDSISGPVTQNEINSFKTFMQAQAPADNNYNNLLAHHQGGENIEALGAMYETTGDQQILDLMVTFADHALNGRNDPNTGLINWDGNRELTWPIGANSDGTEVATTEGENGDVIAHIVYCAQLILESPTSLQNATTASDPYGFGATYRQRALTYITQCDRTEDTYLFVWFVNGSNQWWTPNDTRYNPGVNWEHNHPFPWNQQMMLNGGLQRLATCHAILGDDPSRVTRYNTVIQTSINSFFPAMQNGTSGSDPVYVWSYFADPANVFYSVEDNSAHSSYDLMGAFRAYESGQFGITKSQMAPFANTLTDVISLGSGQFSGLVDGTSNTSHPAGSSLWSEWLYTSEFRTDAYTILANADLSKASSKADYFARLMWMKNRRYQAFTLVPTPTANTVTAGNTASFSVAVAPAGAMGGTVSLSASGLPSGATASFSPASINTTSLTGLQGTSTMTVSTTTAVAAGTYPLTISGTNGTVTHTTPVTLTVNNSTATFTITASAGANGSISPSGTVTVNQGANQTFSVTANAGYAVSAVTVDGTSVGAVTSYTFSNVQANHTIAATFVTAPSTTPVNDNAAGVTYTGTWSYSSARGLGDYSDDVHYTKNNGDSVSYTFTGTGIDYVTETNTDEGNINFYIDGVLQTTVSANSASRLVQQVLYSASGLTNASHTLKAVKQDGTYMLLDELIVHQGTTVTYTITASAGTGGTISPSGSVSVNQGANQSFTIAASAGYVVSAVTVDGSSVGAVTTYTFSNVQANHTISAAFAAAPTYTISASAGTNGSISPSGSVSVNQGANQSFTIAANSGYVISAVTVDGSSVGAVSTYTFSNVQANHTISATFASSPTDTNIAPNGTGYGWKANTSSTANTNKTAQAGLNDNNLTTNIDIDSAGDAINAWEAAGVTWTSAKTISSAKFINGDITSGGDGFLTANCTLQYSTDGSTWTNTGWTITPTYPNSSSAGGQTYSASGTALSGVLGMRFVGQVRTTDTSYHWIVKEVQFIGH